MRINLLTGLILIYLLSWMIQSTILLNWDVSWLMHETRRLLAGGTYIHDFPDMNPPMIMYLYIPPVLINHFFSIKIATAFRLYVFFLTTLSLALCMQFIRDIFSAHDKKLKNIFILSISFIFLILPLYEFGQREHILILLTMPYFLMVTTRLEDKKVPASIAILVGILAGLGFSIKPYFLVAFVLIELYYMIQTKNLFAWIRPETVIIGLIPIIYAISIFKFQPDYISAVIPLAARNYYVGFEHAWYKIIFHPINYFCYFVILFYIMQYQMNHYKRLSTVLVIALIGFLFSYYIQRTTWYYHFFPAYSLALLLFVFLFSQLKSQLKSEQVLITSVGVIIFSFIIAYVGLVFWKSTRYKEKLDQLYSFLHNNAEHKPVYFFTTTTTYEFPIVDYANAYPASRYAFLGWIPGLLKREKFHMYDHLNSDKDYYINVVADELNTNKPLYVFIDAKEVKGNIESFSFNYLDYFSQNQNFKQAWQQYHYLTTIYEPLSYKFDVYERNILSDQNHTRMINTL